MTPPKVLGAPNPTSSVMISNTFGAPLGGTTRGSQHGFESSAFLLITPPNGFASGGNCLPSSVCAAAGEQDSGAGCWARVPAAAKVPRDTAISATAIRRIRAVCGFLILLLLLNDMYRLSTAFHSPIYQTSPTQS